MVDEQAVLAFLQHLDLVLSEALRGDEQQRLRRVTMIHALVMALLADPQQLDQALRQAAARLAELDSLPPSWTVSSCPFLSRQPKLAWLASCMALVDSNGRALIRKSTVSG